MSKDIWITSDTHFGHEAFLTFRTPEGEKIRDFASVREMDDCMIENWNATVKQGDKVYHLGDVVMRKQFLRLIPYLKGKLRLIRGNHDIFPTKAYLDAGFEEIYGVRVLDQIIMSHFPLRDDSIERFKGNVHGHVHEQDSPSSKHFNACVERHNYTPVHFDVIKTHFETETVLRNW